MFPALYHAHHSMHNEDLAFWQNLISERQDAILELGVGTGRVYSSLTSIRKQVIGLDINYQMLRFLRENLQAEYKEKPLVFQGDFTAFHLASRFGLILMPCNTYSTLTPEQRTKTLNCVIQHLLPGGVFAFSVPNPEIVKKLPAVGEAEVEEVVPHPLDQEPVQVSSEWLRTHDQFTLFWHYDHLLPDGRVERLSEKVVHQLADAAEYRAEILAAGFKSLIIYGDFDRSALTSASPSMIIVASF